MPKPSVRRLATARNHLRLGSGAVLPSRASAVSDAHTTTAERGVQNVGAVATELTAGLRLLEKGGQADLCAGA